MAGTLVEDESENVQLITFMLCGAHALPLGVFGRAANILWPSFDHHPHLRLVESKGTVAYTHLCCCISA
jgi:hypothetical protein